MKPVTSLFSKKGNVKEKLALRKAFNEAKEVIQRKVNPTAFDLARPVFLVTDASDVARGGPSHP